MRLCGLLRAGLSPRSSSWSLRGFRRANPYRVQGLGRRPANVAELQLFHDRVYVQCPSVMKTPCLGLRRGRGLEAAADPGISAGRSPQPTRDGWVNDLGPV